jgi:hypothetical protein
VGKVDASIHYEHIAWSSATADAARLGTVSNPKGSDLQVLGDELKVNRLTYRYIESSSCAIAERCVGGSGWRRLLQFNASEKDIGVKPVDIGNIDYFLDSPDVPTPNANHHLYEYSACHQHYHFSHYATFSYGGDPRGGGTSTTPVSSVSGSTSPPSTRAPRR